MSLKELIRKDCVELDAPYTGKAELIRSMAKRLAASGVVTDAEAVTGLKLLSEEEGIIPALESAHALAYAAKLAPTLSQDQVMIVNLSGRGDKDMQTVARALGVEL